MIIKEVFKYSTILLTISVSFSIILLFDNPMYHAFGFWLTVFVAMFIAKFEITHPLFWFSGSFGLYSTAYSLIYILGYPVNSGYSKENILLSLGALTLVLLVVGVKQYNSPLFYKTKNYKMLSNKLSKTIIEYILIVLLCVLLASVLYLLVTPFNHKNEMLENRNLLFMLGAYGTRFLTFFSCFYMLLFIDKDRKKTKILMFSSGVLVILFSLFTGEKDAMFRFFIVLIMTLFFLKKINKKAIFILIPIGMVYLILAGYLKYYFVSGEVKKSLEDQSFIYNFLNSDFNAAGENLQILVNNSWTKSFHGFSLIITDIISSFLPSGLFVNVGNWYNNTFYPGSYSRAFTLVGQGYVTGGIVGIMAIFLILGVLIKINYRNATKNIYWLMVYIYSIPTIISAFRSTISTVVTDLTRIALFSIVIHALLYLLFSNRVKSNK